MALFSSKVRHLTMTRDPAADHPCSPTPPADFHHIDLLAHFDRERIPERVVCIIILGIHSCIILISNLLGSC